MLCKWSSVLPVVATMFVLVTGDCIKDAIDSASKGNLGGYRLIKDPEKDPVVKKIVADSIKLQNKNIPPEFGSRYIDDDHYLAYSAVCRVSHYCCQFQIMGVCGDKSEDCIVPELVCAVTAYKDYSATFATINEGSLNCTKVD